MSIEERLSRLERQNVVLKLGMLALICLLTCGFSAFAGQQRLDRLDVIHLRANRITLYGGDVNHTSRIELRIGPDADGNPVVIAGARDLSAEDKPDGIVDLKYPGPTGLISWAKDQRKDWFLWTIARDGVHIERSE